VTDVAFYGFWLGFWLLMPTAIFLGTLALAAYDLVTMKGYRQPCGPVLITGCDMGFGKDLALALAAKGWTVRMPGVVGQGGAWIVLVWSHVFISSVWVVVPHTLSPLLTSKICLLFIMQVIAACSTEAGLDVYKATANSTSSNITPVKMDMSSETDIQAVAERLAIQHPEGLYALVNNNNNTVVGKDGLIEWMSIDNYKMYVGHWVGWARRKEDEGSLCLLLPPSFFLYYHVFWLRHARKRRVE